MNLFLDVSVKSRFRMRILMMTKSVVCGLSMTQNGVTTNVAYSYDGEGNRATQTVGNTANNDNSVTSYAYDSQQRLTLVSQSVNGAAAATVMKCGYRSDGLRAWKENAQGVRTYFLYDGSNLIGEFDQNGNAKAIQTWGAEGLASRQTTPGTASGNRFYSWDPRGHRPKAPPSRRLFCDYRSFAGSG